MLCKILKDFMGSQDGLISEKFEEGTVRDISDYLYACIDKSWVAKVTPDPVIENKAIISEGKSRKGK